MNSHRRSALKPKTRAHRWLQRQFAWGRSVQTVVLALCSVEESSAVEREWIAKLGGPGVLLNQRVGGNGNPGVGRVVWDQRALALLATIPDAYLAKLLGCSRSTVTYRRKVHGLARVKQPLPASTVYLTEAQEALLGTQPDYVLAAAWGVSKFVVGDNRRRRGVASYAQQTGNDGRIRRGDPHRRWARADVPGDHGSGSVPR